MKSDEQNIEHIVKIIEKKTGYTVIGRDYTKTNFNDSSLDLAEPGQNYMQMITPGYIITTILKDGSGKKYEKTYHSNKQGNILKEKK